MGRKVKSLEAQLEKQQQELNAGQPDPTPIVLTIKLTENKLTLKRSFRISKSIK